MNYYLVNVVYEDIIHTIHFLMVTRVARAFGRILKMKITLFTLIILQKKLKLTIFFYFFVAFTLVDRNCL